MKLKVAIFCPHLPGESEEAWKTRQIACRLYLRQFPRMDGVEFDTLDHLKFHYPRHSFRRVIVAHKGYYSQDFTEWAFLERVPVLDVLALSSDSFPEAKSVSSLGARSRMLADQEARIKGRWM